MRRGKEHRKEKMQITEKNCRIADKIIEILANEKCTVEDGKEILSTISREIEKSSTVQVGKKFSKVYYH